MSRWVWGLFGGIFVAGFVFVVHMSIKPKPIRMVKPSYFDTAEEIGTLIWSRYGDRFIHEPSLVVGVQPGSEDQARAAKAFLHAAQASGFQIKSRMREARMNLNEFEDGSSWEAVNLQRGNDALVERLKMKGSVSILPTTFTSHVIGETPVQLAEKELGKKVLTISFVRFVITMADLKGLQPACDGQAVFGQKTIAALGCAARRKSMSTFRKKLKRDRYVMAMEQTGEKDYLVYIAVPKR